MTMWVMGVFVVSRTVVLVAAHLALEQPVSSEDFMVAMSRWDAGWYASIAERGYEYADDGEQHNIAFFPLFPWLTRGLVPLMPGEGLRPFWLAQTLIAHAGALVGMAFVYVFTRRLGGESAAAWALCFTAFFPPSLFLGAGYPEGIFLAFVAGAGVALLGDRIVLAAVLIGIASACRPTSLAFVPTLLFMAWKRWRDSSQRIWYALGIGIISIAGGLSYVGLLTYSFGSPYVYARNFEAWLDLHRLAGGWDLLTFQPWVNRAEDFVRELREWPINIRMLLEPAWLTLVWMPAALLISIHGLIVDRTELRKFYWIPVFLVLIPYWSSRGTPPTFEAIGRYLTAAYPISAALGLWVDRGSWKPLAAMGIALMAVLMAYGAYCFALPGGPFVG
jgi:hypothetical protein